MTIAPSGRFSEANELIQFARKFINNRIDSLEKDVLHCLRKPFAPFPAILYCFSTIDLLGALYADQGAEKDPATGNKVNTTANSKRYMEKFMNYTEEQRHLLMDIFRHKLVHLAQPKAVIKDLITVSAIQSSAQTTILSTTSSQPSHRTISWRYYHNNRQKHLTIEKAAPDTKIKIKSYWEKQVDYIFIVGISQLAEDIKSSVEKPAGYINSLEMDSNLQTLFGKAIEEIYDL